MRKKRKRNPIQIVKCSFNKKGELILEKPIFLKEKRRNPNEVIKVIVMPDGDVFLYEERLYEGLLNALLWFHPKPQIKEMTWKEYKKKENKTETRRIEELRKILIAKKKAEENLKKKIFKDDIKFGFGYCP